MAYRRTVASRAKLFYQHRNRVAPSFSQTHRDDNDSRECPIPRSPESGNYFQHRLRSSLSTLPGPKISFGDRRFAIPASCGVVLGRNFSSVGEGAADKIQIPSDAVGAADNIEIPKDLLDAVREKAAEVGLYFDEGSLVVAILMAIDSFFPVAALQNLIYYVHVYTGLNWWASIVSTNIFICSLNLPHLIKLHRANTKLTLLVQKLDAIGEEIRNQEMNPTAVANARERGQKLIKEYGVVTPFTPYRLILRPLISILIFVCFVSAVGILIIKYPSFKEGGIFWFTDLSTRDSTYIFPVLTSLTSWIFLEWGWDNVKFHSPTMNFFNVALEILVAAVLPKAMLLPIVTTGAFYLGCGLALRKPTVKKLGIPIIPLTPPSTNQGMAPSSAFNQGLKSLDKGKRK